MVSKVSGHGYRNTTTEASGRKKQLIPQTPREQRDRETRQKEESQGPDTVLKVILPPDLPKAHRVCFPNLLDIPQANQIDMINRHDFFPSFVVLGMEPRVSCMLGKH